MAANLEYVDLITNDEAADIISSRSVLSMELGDGLDEHQSEIALHLTGGLTLYIGAQLNVKDPLASLWFGVPKS